MGHPATSETNPAPESATGGADAVGTKAPERPADRIPHQARGALFRALVDAGSDALVAYTASEETESMISGSVSAQIPPLLAGIHDTLAQHSRTLAEHGRKLDEHGRKLDEHSRILAEHTRILEEHGRILEGHGRILAEHGRMLVRLDTRLTALEGEVRALRELLETNLEANLAAIRTQFRLVWGALGFLVTVLIAVFGFLLPIPS